MRVCRRPSRRNSHTTSEFLATVYNRSLIQQQTRHSKAAGDDAHRGMKTEREIRALILMKRAVDAPKSAAREHDVERDEAIEDGRTPPFTAG